MVAIVTGLRLGLVRDSAMLLGSQGQLGTALLGQGGNRVTVNAANGNLIVQTQDEMLIGRGPDEIVGNTYNSQTANGNPAWRESFLRRVELSGTLNSATSTVTRYASDGSDIVYAYATSGIYQGSYVANEAGGAYDVLTYAEDAGATNKRWIWTEGRTRLVEEYDYALGRLKSTKDADGNALTYRYNGNGQMDRITTANGNSTREFTDFTYLSTTSSQITKAMTTYLDTDGVTVSTRTRIICEYDSYNRLHKVTIDLSPKGSAISDNNTVVTVYDYVDTTSNRIATITEKNGSGLQSARLDITYSGTQVASLVQTSATGQTETTLFRYGSGWTTVTDPQGNSTTLVYDSSNRLTQVISPPAVAGKAAQIQAFAYDSNGNLLYSGPAGDPNFSNIALNWNNTYASAPVATTQTTEVDGGINVYRRRTMTTNPDTPVTPASGFKMNLGQSSPGIAVMAGQTVQASVYVASSGASALTLYAEWRDANGGYLGATSLGAVATGGVLGASGVATAKLGSGSSIAPAGAAYVQLTVQATADGTGPLNVAIAQPSVAIAAPATDANFTNLAVNWNNFWTSAAVATTQTTEVDGGIMVYRRVTMTTNPDTPITPASGFAMNMGQSTASMTAVASGQTVRASVYAASSGASAINIWATWYDANGTNIGACILGSIATGGVLGASGVATAKLGSGSWVAPAGAAYVQLTVQAIANGTGPLNVAIAQPTILVGSGMEGIPVPSFNYSYDANGNRLSMTDALGHQTLYTYDGNNQMLTRTVDALGAAPQTTRYVYDGESHLTYVISPLGEVTRYVYNTYGQQTNIIQFSSADLYVTSTNPSDTTMYGWATATARTETAFHRTDMVYDFRGNLSTSTAYGTTNPDGSGDATTAITTTYVYDLSGQLYSRQVSGMTGSEFYLYDGLGRVTSVKTFNGKETTTVYANTGNGLTATVSMLNGKTEVSTYDQAGELVSYRIYGAGIDATTYYYYDSNGNRVRTVDPTGLSSYAVYDELNRKVADVAADGSVTTYAYNTYDQLVSTIAYGTRLTTAQLATLNNATATQAAALATSIMLSQVKPTTAASDRWSWNVYDAEGRLVQGIDALGFVTAYTYDNADRLIKTTAYATAVSVTSLQTTAPTSPVTVTASSTNDRTIRRFYDNDGQLIAVLDAEGYLTQTVYDAFGQKTQTLASATVTGSSYWASGTLAQLKASITASNDDIANWFYYDDAGRLLASVDGEGFITRYANYNAAGYAQTVTRGGNAITVTATTTYATLPATTGAVEVTTYTYDQYGHILTSAVTPTGGPVETTTYVYDDVYRLTSQTVASTPSTTGRMANVMYDAGGRKIKEMSGIGSAALAALVGPTPAQIDAVWNTYATTYTYDAAGRLIAQTDPKGVITGTGTLAASGSKTVFYYNVDGQLSYKVDGTGGVVRYLYDAFGEVSDVRAYANKIATSGLTGGLDTALTTLPTADDNLDSHTVTNYDLAGHVDDTTVTVINKTGNATETETNSFDYNAFGDLTSKLDFFYKSSSGTQSWINTTQTYSRRGLLMSSTADVGASPHFALLTGYSYDAFGQVISVTDPNGNVTGYDYDPLTHKVTVTDPNNATSSTVHDAFGRITSTIDRNNKTTSYAYDLFGRKVTVTDRNLNATATSYNAYGEVVSVLDGSNTSTSKTYDADGRVISETDGNNKITRYVYDNAGQVAFVIDRVGSVTGYGYDAEGRVIQATKYAVFYTASGIKYLSDMTTWVGTGSNAVGSLLTKTTYDSMGHVLTVTDANNVVTTYTYDPSGRKLKEVVDSGDATHLNLTTTWEYNGDRIVTVNSPEVRAITYTYDNVGRLLSEVVDPGTGHLILTTTYEYDKNGNVVTRTDPAGGVTRHVYNKLNAVSYDIDPTGALTAYTYDPEGRITQTVLYAARITIDTSSANSIAVQVTNWLATAGNVNALADMVTTYQYDAGGRQTKVIVDPGTGHLALTTTYAYDADNNLSLKTDGVGKTTRYVYDGNNRLMFTLELVDRSGTSPNYSYSHIVTGYSYNDVGQRTQTVTFNNLFTTTTSPIPVQDLTAMQSWASTNATSNQITRQAYDAFGRLAFNIDATNAVTGYTYDGDGRVTQTIQYWNTYATSGIPSAATIAAAVAAHANDLTTRSVYDAAGRLAYVIDPTGAVTGYEYDKDGKVKRSNRYALINTSTGAQLLSNMTAWGTPTASDRSNRYSYDLAGRLAYTIDPYGIVTGYSYDACGRVTQTYVYTNRNTSTTTQTLTQMNTWVTNNAAGGGLSTRSAYDAAGHVAYAINADNAVTAYSYDSGGRVIQTVQYATRYGTAGITDLFNQVSGWTTSNAVPANQTSRAVYDLAGRVAYTLAEVGFDASNNPLSTVTYSVYDKEGRVTQTTRYAAFSTLTGTQTLQTMANWVTANTSTTNDRTTKYAYDYCGRVTLVTDAMNVQTKMLYNNFGFKYQETVAYNVTADAVTTFWSFDNDGRVTQITTAYSTTDAETVNFGYDIFGRRTSATDANLNATTYSYDKDGRLKTTTSPITGVVTYNDYNIFGDLVKVTDPNGNYGYFYYDADGRKIMQVDAMGYVTKTDYYNSGQVKSVTRCPTAVDIATYSATNMPVVNASSGDDLTSFTYDGVGRVKSSTDGMNFTTAYDYDAFGNRTTVTNALNAVVTYSYDKQGNLKSQVTPASSLLINGVPVAPSSTTTYSYNAFGDRIQMVEPWTDTLGVARQRTTNYGYDLDGRLTSQSGDSVALNGTTTMVTPTQTFEYDKRGNQIRVKDANANAGLANGGVTVTWYDDHDRKIEQIDALGYLTTWTYDDNGNVKFQYIYGDKASTIPDPSVTTTPPSLATLGISATNVRKTEYTYDKEDRLKSTIAWNVPKGSWTTANGWTFSATGNVTTSAIDYDKNGNAVKQTDGNGNSTYTWYDKLGHKVADVDADGYLTAYQWTDSAGVTSAIDAEGNVTGQAQYANKAVKQTDGGGNIVYNWYDKQNHRIAQVDLSGNMNLYVFNSSGVESSHTTYAHPVTGTITTLTTLVVSDSDDRVTTFTYDDNGHRLSETRMNVVNSTVGDGTGGTTAGVVTTTTGNATIYFSYNGLGQITQKTEASGDITKYLYDTMGRLTRTQTAANDTAHTEYTVTFYDALGNITKTVAGYGATGAETTSYTFDAAGRILTRTDANTTFTTTYGYDANGQQTVESYRRYRSDGTTFYDEANLTTYDALGHTISTAKGTKSGASWVVGDTTHDTFYNAYGEVVARGTNAVTSGVRDMAKAQEFADYDFGGHIWRTNMDGGVVRVYAYDGNGNATLQIQSQGATDLLGVADITAAIGAAGTSKTYNVYDVRNELIDVRKLANGNIDGTLASGGHATIVGTGTVTFSEHISTGKLGSAGTNRVGIQLSSASLSTVYGTTGRIYVRVTYAGTTLTADYPSGTTSLGTNYITHFSNGDGGSSVGVSIYYQDGSGPQISLFNGSLYEEVEGEYLSYDTSDIETVGNSLQFEGVDPRATALTMYVRSGPTGAYTAVSATPGVDYNNNPVFLFDTAKPPFSATAGTWEVKYLATDGNLNVVDAMSGTLTLTGVVPAIPTVSNFVAVPVFTATAVSGGYNLSTSTTVTYVDVGQSYNAFGDVVTQTDARGKATTFTYNTEGKQIKRTGPTVWTISDNAQGQVVAGDAVLIDEYYYDKSGRQVGHKDARGYTTSQALLAGTGYDDSEAKVTIQYNPDGTSASSTYDIFGNLTAQTDAALNLTTYSYDADNRLKTVTHTVRTGTDATDYTSGGVTQLVDTYTYDGLGQRIKHSNNFLSGAETTDYDLQNRVASSVSFAGLTTSYSYAWTVKSAAGRVSAGKGDAGYWKTTTTNSANLSSWLNTDVFGKLVGSKDFNTEATPRTVSYNYDFAGQLTLQSSNKGQSISYTYTTGGQVASITDTGTDPVTGIATGAREVFAYDNNGNRTVEGHYHIGTTNLTNYYNPYSYEYAIVTYDALNRVTEFKDGKVDITYAYDANSNRREIKSIYHPPADTVLSDYWYKYDEMNRFTVTKGKLVTDVNSANYNKIVADTATVTIQYNLRGDRKHADFGVVGSGGHYEDYYYTADGYLDRVTIGGVKSATRVTDILGRLTTYTEYKSEDLSELVKRTTTYDRDNRVTDETDVTHGSHDGTAIVYTNVIHNDYKAYNVSTYSGADQGVLVHSLSSQTQTDTTTTTTTNTNYYYTWWNQAKSSTVTINAVDPSAEGANQNRTGNSQFTYDVNGNLWQVIDVGAANRTITYKTDVFGQVLYRLENSSQGYGVLRNFFYLNGRAVGDMGDDKLASRVDYAQQLADDRAAANTTGAPNPILLTPVVGFNSSFDNYDAYNSTAIGQAGTNYTTSGGETLATIAQSVWGDASLWYILAQANGLSPNAVLVAGQSLTIPGNVAAVHNNSDTFRPYDPNDALGNTNPTLPPQVQPPAPKKHGCGAIGDFIANIVAAVVDFVVQGLTASLGPMFSKALGAAAGDAARQLVEIAFGNQDKFSWAEVGASALAAAVGEKLNTSSFGKAINGAAESKSDWVRFAGKMAQAVEANVIQQGANLAFGVQKKFDWTSVALSGATAGAKELVETQFTKWEDKHLPKKKIGDKEILGSKTDFGKALKGAAQILAKATTTSLITKQDFGKSLRDATVEAVKSTVGDWFIETLSEAMRNKDLKVKAPVPLEELDAPLALGQLDIRDIDQSAQGGTTGGWMTSSDWRDSPLTNPHYFDASFEKYNYIGSSAPAADGLALVKSGDSVSKIANGDPALIAAIWAANGLEIDANGGPKILPGQLLLIPNLGNADADTLKQLDTAGRNLIANNQKGIDAYHALLAQQKQEAFYQEYPGMRPIDRTCSLYSRYSDNGAIVDYDPRALKGWNQEPFVLASEQAALKDARRRASTTPGAVMAIDQGFTFNTADDLDAWSAYAETETNNFLHQFGLTPGAAYNGLQARDAVLQADAERLDDFRTKHPIAFFGSYALGAIANPVNRVGGGWAGAAKSLPGLMWRGALFGGATGALYGAGDGTTWEERGNNAMFGAGSGAVLGGALPVAGKYLFEPAAQAAKPLLDQVARIRVRMNPNALGMNGGNLEFYLAKIPNPMASHPNYVEGLPFSYKQNPFQRFVGNFNDEFSAAGFDDAQGFMQGSGASGVKFNANISLDAKAGILPSDWDVGVVSPKLAQRAQELGLNVFKGPLTNDQIGQLGLTNAQNALSAGSKYQLRVNFKVYDSIESVYSKQKTIPFSDWTK